MVKKIILLVILDLSAAIFARYSFNEESLLALFASVICIVFAGLGFMELLKENVTVIINAIWIGLGTLFITIASYFLFGESISVVQTIAMCVIVLGLALVGYEKAVTVTQ